MKLFTIDPRSIPMGEPLTFSLRSEDGVLLARQGHRFVDRATLGSLAAHGKIYVAMQEAQAYFATVKRHQASGDVSTRPAGSHNPPLQPPAQKSDPAGGVQVSGAVPVDWLGLQSRANALLRSPQSANFLQRLTQLQQELLHLVRRSPDATLFALTHMAAQQDQLYSATHALFVTVICALAAHEVLQWPHGLESSMSLAALTMNLSMTDLQDRLAVQDVPLSEDQQAEIRTHAQRSAEILKILGVADPVWLGAIASHHQAGSGTLASRPPADQVARLIHRADIFTARLSPRATRVPMASLVAMKAAYFDEEQKVDAAGASLIKALGVHHPGALVKLASGEVAIVVRRGANRLHPQVAVLVNRKGLSLAEPLMRDTGQPEFAIASSLDRSAIMARTDLLRLFAVAAT
jgi:HD-GYP domain-containing protein (c-di-GMP phosphodiesterase class II)